MSAAFRPTALQHVVSVAQPETPEDRHWKNYSAPRMIKELRSITNIDFSPARPFNFAVTAGNYVHIYDGRRAVPSKKIQLTKTSTVTSGTYRSDGNLLVAGTKHGKVKIVNVAGKNTLREFDGHSKAVWVSKFLGEETKVFSAGEEGIVKLWDIPTETEVLEFDVAKDYIKTGCKLANNPHTFVVGGYDHKARLCDTRSKEVQLEVSHDAGIESLCAFQSGTILVTAGETYLRVWDLVAGRLLEQLSNHRQAITDICLDRNDKRLFSVSLDRMLKVYDVHSWGVVHSMKFPGHILSVGVSPSPSENILAVGQSDGYLSVRVRKQKKDTQLSPPTKRKPRFGSKKYFLRGQSRKPTAIDYRVKTQKKKKLRKYDVHLKSFRYREALDAVMNSNTRPLVKASVLFELVQREGLLAALSNRDDVSLEPILAFVVKHITHPRYTKLLVNVAQMILDIYSPGMGRSAVVDHLFKKLSVKLDSEVRLQKALEEISGAMDALVACSTKTSSLAVSNEDGEENDEGSQAEDASDDSEDSDDA